MPRAHFDSPVQDFLEAPEAVVIERLVQQHHWDVDPNTLHSWTFAVEHLKAALVNQAEGHVFLEYGIPRLGKRIDALLLLGGTIVVVEYKVGATAYDRSGVTQVMDYALDLKHFHEGSHHRRIIPVLLATQAPLRVAETLWYRDEVAQPVLTNADGLEPLIERVRDEDTGREPIDTDQWRNSGYKPTPTILEAARALYRGHSVEEISRSDAGAVNLSATADTVREAVDSARQDMKKVICFVTGVPGSGKTLAGLNLATGTIFEGDDPHGVFLSGNGPLVTVLREALALDEVETAEERGEVLRIGDARRRASTFIQNVHHYRDEALQTDQPLSGRIVVFDEAQRAWDEKRTTQFVAERHGVQDFGMSEPAFLLSAMDRHEDWCVVVCLVGNGQEINRGEAGIGEWFRALDASESEWEIWYSPRFEQDEPAEDLGPLPEGVVKPSLHLDVSVRSFRAESMAAFVGAVLEGDADTARAISHDLDQYPTVLTRNLGRAREWLRAKARGGERFGLVASSNALRLKPEGIHVKADISEKHWFLYGPEDVRSSFMLEDAASEFEVQGLELDWVAVCWDANLRRVDDDWSTHRFRGTRWVAANPPRREHLINSYRVLLTRARQGLCVFVPRGDEHDATRDPEIYDGIADFLVECGFEVIDPEAESDDGGPA